jgi:hypothetical protein
VRQGEFQAQHSLQCELLEKSFSQDARRDVGPVLGLQN